jgi:hypothetical protein
MKCPAGHPVPTHIETNARGDVYECTKCPRKGWSCPTGYRFLAPNDSAKASDAARAASVRASNTPAARAARRAALIAESHARAPAKPAT